MYYAGIGSRQTPAEWLEWFTLLAERLAANGFILRSGGADGADSAFWLGAGVHSEVYLPWKGFNHSASELYYIMPEAFEMAKHYHPAWNRCSPAARKFHARNCYQVLGYDLATPSKFVVCWTPGGKIAGGTGQALRIAEDKGIPIFNFGSDVNKTRDDLYELVTALTKEK